MTSKDIQTLIDSQKVEVARLENLVTETRKRLDGIAEVNANAAAWLATCSYEGLKGWVCNDLPNQDDERDNQIAIQNKSYEEGTNLKVQLEIFESNLADARTKLNNLYIQLDDAVRGEQIGAPAPSPAPAKETKEPCNCKEERRRKSVLLNVVLIFAFMVLVGWTVKKLV